jgi:hypothetical protein
MNAIPKDLIKSLCTEFSRWDPMTAREPEERLFEWIAKPFGGGEVLVLGQDPSDPKKFSTEWPVNGNAVGQSVTWSSTARTVKATGFLASDAFLATMRKVGYKQKAGAILLDSKFSVDLKWEEVGDFDPKKTDVGVLLYPFSMGGRDALLCIVGSRKSAPTYESLFKVEDRDRFALMGALVAPCFQAARILIDKDLASWRKFLREPYDMKRPALVCFLKGMLGRAMVDLSKLTLNSHPIDVMVDIMSYLVTNRIDADDRGEISQLIGRFEKLLQAFDGFAGNLCSSLKEIRITWRFLLGFFLHCFIQEIQKNKLTLASLSEQELLELYCRLAKAVKFYLLWASKKTTRNAVYFRNTSRRDYTEEATDYFVTIGYLASEYASLVDGVDRRLNIEGDLRKMAMTQALFYATKERYRDHFLHVLDVCLLGLFLVKAVFPEHSVFSCRVPLRNWFLASLCHDVGYIMELQDMRTTETAFLDFPEIKEFRDRVASEVESAETRFNERARERFHEAALQFPASLGAKMNHGVVSALHVLDLLKNNLGKAPEDARDFVQGHADTLYAIAAHDFSDVSLDVSRYPLAVLLRLCDELQDWDRPRIDVLSFREQILAAVKYGGAFTPDGASMMRHVRIEATGNPFTGKLTWSSTPTSKVPRLCITLDYRTVDDPGFFIIYSWLLKSQKFQGIVLKNTMDIEITFLSKPRAEEGDMNRFKVARRKHRIWHFEEWMDLVDATDPDDNGDERLTVSVSKLNTAYPIRVNPGDYLKTLIQEW